MTSKPLIIGHRGASAMAPENTMAAFRLALDSGADGIEFDVRLTRDGIPVVIHDADLKRTGSRPERVADLAYDEIRKVDVGSWFNRTHTLSRVNFSGEKIPSLDAVLTLFESNKAILYLEMKSDPRQLQELAQICSNHLRRSSVKDRTIVECFDLAGIAALKSIDPSIKTAALFEPRFSSASLIASTRLVKKTLDVAADEIALHHRLVTARVVDAAKKAGLKVVVWTVDDPAWMRRAARMEVSALITNDPAMMVKHA